MDRKPTEMQQDAINSKGRVILKSCPGSGKTYVVAKKMIKEISEWKYKNSGVALLSFTNVASEEAKNRIKELSNISVVCYPHFIGTIDSFISKYLYMPFGHLIMKCKDKPKLIQEESLNMDGFMKQKWKRECYSNCCSITNFYIDIDGVMKDTNNKLSQCCVSGKKPCDTLKREMYTKGLGTYMDMTIVALKILKSYPEIGRLLANKFPTLIVDEAQDTSEYQMEIIDLLVSYGVGNIMLIGDPDQAIYEWRDADPSVFIKKYDDKNEWKAKLLNDNFRCSQNICNATKVFSSLDSISRACGETSVCKLKPTIYFYERNNNSKEAIDYFLNKCKENDIQISSENVAVLVRGRSGLVGKDYSMINNLWQSEGASIFSQAAYERDLGNLKRALKLVENGLKYYYIDSSRNFINIDDEKIEKEIGLNVWKKVIFEVCKEMPSSNTELNKWVNLIEEFLEKVSNKYELNIQDDAKIKIKSRDNKLPDFKQQPIKNFYIKSIKTEEYLNSTIHSVKGKTFDAVLLIISSNGKLTANKLNKAEINSEEIRTGYVAMTRARQLLVVAFPNTVKKKSLTRFPEELWDYYEGGDVIK